MPRIERLPESLVTQIAAGEVVERPASVVKELVENALDAGARSVTVEIEGGGRSLVRVRDDGCGMAREDAPQALEPHATSKLRRFEDLQAIATHGFRGEALHAIAAVADLVLRTREESSPAGTEVAVRFGGVAQVREVGHPRGTTVEVRDLFGATPGRQKFLRHASYEAGLVAEAVTLAALARPEIGFTLNSGGRGLVQAPAVDGLTARIYQVFGGGYLDGLLPVNGGLAWARVTGMVTRPDRPAPRRPTLRLFVNGRPVRDRAIVKAVAEGYVRAGAGDRRAEAILFVDVPTALVDVNVHPAKAEVRFADGRTVWTAVERAVRDALSAGTRGTGRAETGAAPGRVEEAVTAYLAGRDGAGGLFPEDHGGAARAPSASPEPVGTLLPSAPPTVLGQHRNTYIVASDGQDLILVDQHTAHERVRFELLLDAAVRQAPPSQMLLTPAVVTLAPDLAAILDGQAEHLRAVGFDVEGFGGGSARLRAVPAVLGTADPGPALIAILRDLLERESSEWAVGEQSERVAATVACHSSVRAGEPLSPEAMAAIVRDLGSTRHPDRCPHGRPTTARILRDDVARWFERTGWRRR
jgi:DNA mismatch repair protein MutL